MTSEEIRAITFEQDKRGYNVEDVDAFLNQIASEMDQRIRDKEDSDQKMIILAQKVEEYRGQEDTLKTALINAQRMGEMVVHEAKQKADTMVRDATGRSQLLNQQLQDEIVLKRQILESMDEQITQFKTTILNLYKQHIEALSALDAPVEEARGYMDEFDTEHPEYTQVEDQEEVEEAERERERERETEAFSIAEQNLENTSTSANLFND